MRALPLPVLLFLAAACGAGDEAAPSSPAAAVPADPGETGPAPPEAAEQAPASGALWELPPVPGPVEVEADGVQVPRIHVESFLEKEWQRFCFSREQPEEATAEAFFADPQALFRPFARDLALLSEATARWPELDPAVVQARREELERAFLTTWKALVDRWGEDEVLRHLEARIRIERMMDLLAEEGPPVTEEEIRAFYEDYRAEKGEHPEFGFPSLEQLRPRIEGLLRARRRDEAVQAWQEEHLAKHDIRVRLPDGREVRFGGG